MSVIYSKDIGAVYRKAVHPQEATAPFRPAPPLKHETILLDGSKVLLEKDLAIPMRDGIKLYADIYRPIDSIAEKTPTIVMWGPFGKHGAVPPKMFENMGVDFNKLSKYTHWELPDPLVWCADYKYSLLLVDPRGCWWSGGGEPNHILPEEGRDGYDLVEWVARQPWCTGKIGWGAVSYYAMSAYHVAELQPPHLSAIMPWEGISDPYREVNTMWMNLTADGLGLSDDHAVASLEHPLFDDWWRSRVSDWTKIEVPAYSVTGFSSLALHLRGTIEAWKQFSSPRKYLKVRVSSTLVFFNPARHVSPLMLTNHHGGREWEAYYTDENIRKQKLFWDRFLKDESNGVDSWPNVELSVRTSADEAVVRSETSFPPERAELTQFHISRERALSPDASTPGMEPHSLTFKAHDVQEQLAFDYKFSKRTEITGNSSAKLHIQVLNCPDVDLFLALQKINAKGEEVKFYHSTEKIEASATFGWFRASHRELDPERSIPGRPYHSHARRQWLRPCDIYPVEVELWPTSTVWEDGEIMRLVVKGTPFTDSENLTQARIPSHSFGQVKLWFGGEYDSGLSVPIVHDE
ncbi:uncharacterized protein Z518_06444 [Rhinocladiella mackenziei CBS 650.93]|uniref:Xaa-Pro dipeptidyl-peptidase C-terminal domain-containing protein n=1 Tax=Rhinocladiella mackenziei CBS 650.93 TaxID=1442369 RepID=A0A0D2FTZ8_9EURO|nr:uncharacterized protein Z518_06444 [Rhinocladiella mackenziei CBS 650.93]KIX05572.1 hypothetical protein Z518_06444 [Rhinocladiella mackenziei CBS 650.93]